MACFRQVVPVQPAVPVRRTRRPYKLSGFVNRSHLRTEWWRGNTFRERSSAGLRMRIEWRVCRAQIVRSLGAYLNCRPPTFQLLSYLMFYIMRRRHVWQGANISCRRLYLWNNLCKAQLLLELRIFHERRHFSIDADILGRRHFA